MHFLEFLAQWSSIKKNRKYDTDMETSSTTNKLPIEILEEEINLVLFIGRNSNIEKDFFTFWPFLSAESWFQEIK